MFLIAVRADNVVLQIRTALEEGNIPFEQSQHIIPGDKGRFYVQFFPFTEQIISYDFLTNKPTSIAYFQCIPNHCRSDSSRSHWHWNRDRSGLGSSRIGQVPRRIPVRRGGFGDFGCSLHWTNSTPSNFRTSTCCLIYYCFHTYSRYSFV